MPVIKTDILFGLFINTFFIDIGSAFYNNIESLKAVQE